MFDYLDGKVLGFKLFWVKYCKKILKLKSDFETMRLKGLEHGNV